MKAKKRKNKFVHEEISNMCIANFEDNMVLECLVFLNKIMLNIYENVVKNLSGSGV